MYKKLNSTTTLIQSTTTEAPQRHMYYTAFQTAQQAHPTCAGRGRQAGAERGSRFGASLRKEKAEGECQSSDASGRSEDGGLSARGRSRRTRLRAFPRLPGVLRCRRPQSWREKNNRIPRRAGCQVLQLPTERRSHTPEALSELFQDWQRTQTQSSVTAIKARDSEWMSGSATARTNAERHTCELGVSEILRARSPERASAELCFPLTKTYLHGCRQS